MINTFRQCVRVAETRSLRSTIARTLRMVNNGICMRKKLLIVGLVFLLGAGSFCYRLLAHGNTIMETSKMSTMTPDMVPCTSAPCFDLPNLSICCSSDHDSTDTIQRSSGTAFSAKKLLAFQSFGIESGDPVSLSASLRSPPDFPDSFSSPSLTGTVIKRE